MYIEFCRMWKRWALIAAAVFAMFWAILRACVESVTIDEGDTYFWFVTKSAKELFHPFPNNHLLNTLLMWASIHVFGTSVLSIRLPALLGAAIYILVCYFLCRGITDRFNLQLSVFVCLVYNPIVLDFMSAARGYSLANAFLLAAIAVPVWEHRTHAPLRTCCAMASLALGLSFIAAFSYTFVDLAVSLAIVAWAIWRREAESLAGILTCCILPGLFIALLIGGYPITHWPKGELFYGAQSLGEMARSLIDVSLHQVNPRFMAIDSLKEFLLPVLAMFCAWQIAAAELDGSWSEDPQRQWLAKFAAGVGAIAAVTVLLHWIAFHFAHLPLPLTRTGLFLLPLLTLLAGAIAAFPARSIFSRLIRRGTAAAFFCLACYFLLCLRIGYFEEYQDDADVKDVYAVLARMNHSSGVTDVVAHSLYVAPLNFYRILSKKETFPEFLYVSDQHLPEGRSIYVLHSSFFREFIAKEKLTIVYRGKSTEIVVAVKPGFK